MIADTSSTERTSGRFRPIFGWSRPSQGLSFLSPSVIIQSKKDLSALIALAWERLETVLDNELK